MKHCSVKHYSWFIFSWLIFRQSTIMHVCEHFKQFIGSHCFFISQGLLQNLHLVLTRDTMWYLPSIHAAAMIQAVTWQLARFGLQSVHLFSIQCLGYSNSVIIFAPGFSTHIFRAFLTFFGSWVKQRVTIPAVYTGVGSIICADHCIESSKI